ncbi:MAG: RNA-binding protein [Hyphomonadaceae bacterium]
MNSNDQLSAPPQAGGVSRRSRERLCIATRQTLPESRLVRFALAPDGAIVPDVAAKLPGRGAWVSASRSALEAAIKRGAFAHALKAPVRIAENLADQTEAALSRRCLDLLGIARRAGALALGATQVEEAIRKNRLLLLIEADDGAAEGREKLMSLHIGLWGAPPLAAAAFSASDLGVALGRERVIHACLLQERLATAWAAEIGRLAGFRPIVPASWPTSWRTLELGQFELGLGGAASGATGSAAGAPNSDDGENRTNAGNTEI